MSNKYKAYEKEKKKLQQKKLTPKEYQEGIKQITEKKGL